MDIRDLTLSYYDKAAITLATKNDEGEIEEETLTIYHRPIDNPMWSRLKAIEAEESHPLPVNVRQLVALDATLKPLTDGGEPVNSITAEHWQRIGEIVQSRIVRAIVPNVRATNAIFEARELSAANVRARLDLEASRLGAAAKGSGTDADEDDANTGNQPAADTSQSAGARGET